MKKIGLISCYIDNYGACLQAFALQQTLISKGYQVDIIRYDYKVFIDDKKESAKSVLSFYLHTIYYCLFKRKYIRSFLASRNGIVRHYKFATFRRNYLGFSKPIRNYDDLLKVGASGDYDFYVCGSDQIWNPTLGFARDLRADTLSFTNRYKIAYAPSIGVSKIPDKYVDIMHKNISLFNAISCRESEGTNIIHSQLLIKHCTTVLDPTLLVDKEFWLSKIKKRNMNKKHYILCYFFASNPLFDKVIKHFAELCLNTFGKKIDILVLPFTRINVEGIKEKYRVDPFEFVNLINNASLVLTDSFHGTAFSINLNTNFYTLMRFNNEDPSSMNSRITSVLGKFSLKDRLIADEEALLSINSWKETNISFGESNTELFEYRKQSNDYLENALNNENSN